MLAACLSIGVCSYSLGTLSSGCITAACPLQSGRVLYYDLHAATAECVSAFETGSGNRRTTKVQSANRARRGLRRRASNAAPRAGSRVRTQWLHDSDITDGSRSVDLWAVPLCHTTAALQSIPAADASAAADCLPRLAAARMAVLCVALHCIALLHAASPCRCTRVDGCTLHCCESVLCVGFESSCAPSGTCIGGQKIGYALCCTRTVHRCLMHCCGGML